MFGLLDHSATECQIAAFVHTTRMSCPTKILKYSKANLHTNLGLSSNTPDPNPYPMNCNPL